MLSRRFAYFYIVSVIFFADTYVVLPWIRVVSIMNYLLLGIIILKRRNRAFNGFNKAQKTFFVLIFYVFVVNLFRNSFQDALSYLLGALTFPFIWKAFSEMKNNKRLISFFISFYLIFTSIFSLFQISGIPLTAGTLLSGTGIIKTDLAYSGVTGQGLRITGADMNSIGYACILGMIIIYYYFRFESEWRYRYLFYVIITVILLLFTQSRAAIFSIIPVIIITKILTQSRIKDRVLLFTGTAFATLAIALILIPVLRNEFPRLFIKVLEDGSVIHRIQANVYGSIGTIVKAPIFGVSFNEGLEAMKIGYQKIGLFIGTYFIPMVTHHNQPLFFLRYYGLVGLFLILLFYFRVAKTALSETNPILIRQIVFGVLLFHFLYTLTHNNKITMDYYLFIILSFNSCENQYFVNEE